MQIMSRIRSVLQAVAILIATIGTASASTNAAPMTPRLFGLTWIGLTCAVCLSMRPRSTPTNGLVPQSPGAFGSVEAAIRQLKGACPDMLLMEVAFQGMSDIDAIRNLKSLCPQAEFMVLAVYDDDCRTFEAMCAGACGNQLRQNSRAGGMGGITRSAWRPGPPRRRTDRVG